MYCPGCNRPVQELFCKECTARCFICGEPLNAGDEFCPSCGNPADKKSSEDKSTKERPRHRFVKTTYNNLYDEEDIPDPNTILWFILGFLQLVICCNPFGIGTIICTHKADKLANAGKMKAANRKIRAAKIWFFIGLSIAAVAVTVFLLMAGL